MVRWAYLIPRIIIISLIALAIWVGFDPLFRQVVQHKLQDATGAKVEIGHLRYSMSNQKIFVKDVAFADPRAPMRNLLQADMAYVELDRESLLSRRVVIERGETSRVVFGAPRTDPGILPGYPQRESMAEFSWKPKAMTSIERLGIEWLDQFPPNDSTDLTSDKLELVQLNRELAAYWTEQLRIQAENIEAIQRQRAELSSTKKDDGNPLRRHFVNTHVQFEALKQQTRELTTRLIELESTALNDRKRLTAAFQNDSEKIRAGIQTTRFDSESVSNLLLTRLQEERIAEIVGWFSWFRSVVPDPQLDFQSHSQRGADIVFPGTVPAPGFLIKSIELEGEGRFANQHFNFAGTAFDLSSQPATHDKPASFELRAQGEQHVIVSCTIDRRGEVPTDTLNILCPDLEISEQLLGEENSLLVTLGPASRIQADIQITATGNQLAGELVFRHSNVSLHVDQLHDFVGGEDTALQLNQGLAAVDRFETRSKLSGTLENYDYQFESDLGDRFANAANQLLRDKCERSVEQQSRQIQKLLTAQSDQLTNNVLREIRRMTKLLEAEQIQIASLKSSQATENGRLRRIR